jgi:hypothetical protein
MRYLLFFLPPLFLLLGCNPSTEKMTPLEINWSKRKVKLVQQDSMDSGTTYLSVYSEIYERSEHRTFDLTATVSLRNINSEDSVFVKSACYYNTHGELIRSYFDYPIFIAPMETVEIVISETDKDGGSGANFLFDWSVKSGIHPPFFEAVMISTIGNQGISFTTTGINR